VRGIPPSSPGEDNEVSGLTFGQAQDFRSGIAMGEGHPHVQVAKGTNAREAVEKFAAPGWPLVLRLIDIAGSRQRTRFRGSSPHSCYMNDQELSASSVSQLCRRSQCRAGRRCAIMRHQDVMKMPRHRAALWGDQDNGTNDILKHVQRCASKQLSWACVAMLAHDDQQRLHLLCDLQNLRWRCSSASMNGKTIED